MIVRFKKVNQNGAALSCERSDGSSTWQRPKPSQAAFFALHDLSHFACESELTRLKGFFALIAGGWEMGDFENKQKNKSLPDDALLVEVIVGLLDTERASGTLWSSDEFNTHIQNHGKTHSKVFDFELNDNQLAAIRGRRDELFARWYAVKPGETMELEFPE